VVNASTAFVAMFHVAAPASLVTSLVQSAFVRISRLDKTTPMAFPPALGQTNLATARVDAKRKTLKRVQQAPTVSVVFA
jgi:hypothetical protein